MPEVFESEKLEGGSVRDVGFEKLDGENVSSIEQQHCHADHVKAHKWHTRIAALKFLCTWGAAAAYFACEIYVHTKCGFGRHFEDTEIACLGLPKFEYFLWLSETLCQSGLVVVLVSLIWEMIAAACDSSFASYVKDHFHSEGSGLDAALAVAFSFFTMGLGVWSWAAEAVPHWTTVYLHVFEAFCTASISAAVAGIVFDALAAALVSHGQRFCSNLLRCDDNLESHGLWEEERVTQYHTSGAKAVLLWLCFSVVIFIRLAEVNPAVKCPAWLSSVLELVSVICSGMLSVGIVLFLFEIAHAILHVKDVPVTKSLNQLVRAYRPAELDSTSSEETSESSDIESSSG
mmetsp:Transcript_31415/g.56954  ORF Transcript_31415/g.56954 Transcript_31415/m.56954 type:complete len:346 (+) Transcript_31415:71-1108(+)